MQRDRSNGWEAVAGRFMAQRSSAGADTVRAWCRALPGRASVLDLGCGSGVPIAEALIDAGCEVSGVDASPSLVAEFRRRFPQAPVVCEPVEESRFFGRTHDGIVAIGLLFLLQPGVQETVIRRLASALKPGGRVLFTAPVQTCTWVDQMTGRQSVSLGSDAYRRALGSAGLVVIGEYDDEGGNHCFDAARALPSAAGVTV